MIKERGARVNIFGAGLVATEMALDLAKRHEVTVFDKNQQRLAHLHDNLGLTTREADLSETETIARILRETKVDALTMALPGGVAFKALETIVGSAAVPAVVDVSFFQENPFKELQGIAQRNGQIVVVQMGIAPGVMNMPASKHSGSIEIQTAKLYCGGLPLRADNPLHHTYQFQDADNLKLFRYPTVIKNGALVHESAFSGREVVEFGGLPHGIPYLEAVNTAGIMASADALGNKIGSMFEKSLRHPGHISAMEVLYALGLFDEQPMGLSGVFSLYEVTNKILERKGRALSTENYVYLLDLLDQLGFFNLNHIVSVTPKTTFEEFTLDLIRPIWKPVAGEDTMTVAKVVLSGTGVRDHRKRKITYSLIHTARGVDGKNSLAPCTALPATATLQAILEGRFTQTGVSGPEHFAMAGDCFEYLLDYLNERGVSWQKEEEID